MKKILIMGTCSSIYVKEYIVAMKKFNPDLSFELLADDFGIFEKYYKKHGIKTYTLPDPRKHAVKRKLMMFSLCNKYDYIHVHVVRNETLELARSIAGNKSKIIISYWDYPSSKVEIKETEQYLPGIYKINFLSENLRNEFIHNYGDKYNNKLVQVDLVMNCLEHILRISDNVDINKLAKKAKKDFGFPKDKYIVAVGYCGRRDQQHIQVINELLRLPVAYRKRLCVFLHVSYGVEMKSYLKKLENLKERCKQYDLQVIISDEFFTGKKLMLLRYAVDMFINAEPRDALSGTMLEYLSTGTSVLNAGWLNYPELDKYHIEYEQFKQFDDLSQVLIDTIEKKRNYTNIEKMKEHWSWENRAPIWNKLYK